MSERAGRKVRVGKVASDKMNKTRTVVVKNLVRHPLYKKTLRRTNKFLMHDENNESRLGDTVRMMETRPLSSRKRWRLVEVVEKAK